MKFALKFMNRRIALTVAVLFLGLACYLSPGFAAAEFSDVPKDHWALSEIKFAAEKGIVQGVKQYDGSLKFLPEDPLTKEQAATMLYRALEGAGKLKSDQDYSYIYSESFETYQIMPYARKPIAYFLEYGVISRGELAGFTLGEAKGLPIQRIQAGVWIAKAIGKDFVGAYYVPYTDKVDILEGEFPYVDLLYRQGLVTGTLQEDGTVKLAPKEALKRSQFAAIANRVYNAAMTENSTGETYVINKETISYKNTLQSVTFNSKAQVIYNGKFADPAVLNSGSGEIVKISSMSLPKEFSPQVHIQTMPAVNTEQGTGSFPLITETGILDDIKPLSSKFDRIGIKHPGDDATIYYIIETSLGKTLDFTSPGSIEVKYTVDGVRMLGISKK